MRAPPPLPGARLAALALTVALALPLAGRSAQAQTGTAAALDPGADLSDCHSALRPGPSDCAAGDVPSTPGDRASASAEPLPRSDALERQVDAFLAAYGKPPREAVRALLDPSDAHIAQLVAKQQETLALAAYVANRMTELQQRDQRTPGPPPGDAALLSQMRLTLVQEPGDPDALEAMQALRAAMDQTSSLRVRIALVGSGPRPGLAADAHRDAPADAPQGLRAELARIDPRFTVAFVPQDLAAASIDTDALPLLLIEDLRLHRSTTIAARRATVADVQAAMAALRSGRFPAAAEAPHDAGAELDPRGDVR